MNPHNKEDRQEIKNLVASIRQHLENENSVNDPDLRFPFNLGLKSCETIVDALDYLLKLPKTSFVGDSEDFKDYETQILTQREQTITEILEFLNETTGRKIEITGARAKKSRDAVKSLLKKKYSIEEIKDVILAKTFEWGKNPQMAIYLHPSTLFSSKFQTYLDLVNDLKANPDLAAKFKNKVNANNRAPGELISQQSLTDITARILDDLANGRDL